MVTRDSLGGKATLDLAAYRAITGPTSRAATTAGGAEPGAGPHIPAPHPSAGV